MSGNELTTDKFLRESEIESLREDLERLPLKGRLAIKVLLYLGMRGCELREIKRGDVNFEEGFIQVRGKKNSKPRALPIVPEIESELREHCEGVSGEEKLFGYSASGLKDLWYRVRPVKGKGVHSLRHTFAVKVYEKTQDIRIVQALMGHRSINNTLIYAEFVDSRKAFQKALIGGLYGG